MRSGIDAADVATNNALRVRLAEPVRTIDLTQAVDHWHHVRIQVRCVGGGDMARDKRTAARVRGALGRQLAEAASVQARKGQPCPWIPPSALDVLFGHHGKLAGGLEIPKPYVIAISDTDGDLGAEVTLFGFASDLAEAAAEALVRGLRSGLNESDADRARYRPLEIADRSINGFDGIRAVEAMPESILLVTMETPLSIRAGDAVKPPDFGDLVSSLTQRVQGLARWQDSMLMADWRALVAEGRKAQNHAVTIGQVEHWRRGSTRQDRSFVIGGGHASWLVDTLSPDLHRLLALGQTTGAGGRTALGLGRFRIEPLNFPR